MKSWTALSRGVCQNAKANRWNAADALLTPAAPALKLYMKAFSVFSSPAGFRRSFRLSRRDKKTNKSMYESKKSEMYDTADVPTYEEVAPYRRPSGAKHRLVVLVGESAAEPGLGSVKISDFNEKSHFPA